MQLFYRTLLTLHIAGMATAIGMTLANFVAFKQFWKLYENDKVLGVLAFRGISKFNLLGMLSVFVVILTGLGMLWTIHWSFWQLLWFKIKLSLVLLLFINGFTMGRIYNEKLTSLITQANDLTQKPSMDIAKLRRGLQTFQVVQLLIFLLIIIMVVFKFG